MSRTKTKCKNYDVYNNNCYYNKCDYCFDYEEEDPILDIKRKTEPMGSGND